MDKLKKLQKENTLLEGRIDNSNNQTYTDMIVYLRGASISPYHQELIRNDIVNMLLEAQERQASLVSVFGEDRHDFINQVIKSTPKISIWIYVIIRHSSNYSNGSYRFINYLATRYSSCR